MFASHWVNTRSGSRLGWSGLGSKEKVDICSSTKANKQQVGEGKEEGVRGGASYWAHRAGRASTCYSILIKLIALISCHWAI